jgi:hypothetical protein
MSFELTNPVYSDVVGSIVPIAFLHLVNAAMNTNQPILNWDLGTPETQCVHASNPRWSADNVHTTSSNMSYTFTSTLSGGVQFVWRVRSVPGATQSDWSTKSRG